MGLDVADLTEPDLRHEVVTLRRRVRKLTVLLRLALALLRTSGFRLTGARLPDGRAKMRIVRRGAGPRVSPVASVKGAKNLHRPVARPGDSLPGSVISCSAAS